MSREGANNVNVVVYGDTTKSLGDVWRKRRNSATDSASGDALRALFNDLGLFPSQSQLFEMVQCSGNGSGSGNAIAFGEFCVFATELKKYYENPSSCSSPKKRCDALRTQKSSTSNYDTFLGGSCNPTTWRADVAIPHLKAHDVTYYNPQTANWVPEMIELEHQAKQTSQVLFFVLNEMTRNVVSMIEVAYFAGGRRNLIVVINPYPAINSFNGEKMSASEYRDLECAMTTVHDLVERRGLPVFNDIRVALTCATKVIKKNVSIEELGLEDNARPVKLAHLQIGDKLVRLREAFDTLDSNHTGKISLADVRMAFRIHAHRDLSEDDLRRILAAHGVSAIDKLDQITVDFDHFCRIVSEFKHTNKSSLESRSSAAADAGASSCGPKVGCGAALKSRSSSSATEGASSIVSTTTSSTTVLQTRSRSGRKASHLFSGSFRRIAHWLSKSGGASSSSSSSTSETPRKNRRAERPSSSSSIPPILKQQRRSSQIRDVYLGGTMTGSRWRERIAIPMLKKQGLTFFNPQVTSSSQSSISSNGDASTGNGNACVGRRLIPIEQAAMDNSRVLLFIILSTSRSVAEMCEAAYYIGRGASNVVLCIQKIPESKPEVEPDGEKLSKAALKDYNRGRCYLSDIANREAVPVFEEIHEAIECILQKCKNLK